MHAAAKSFQSCLTLCDPIDGSPPGSPTPPVPGILQARTCKHVNDEPLDLGNQRLVNPRSHAKDKELRGGINSLVSVEQEVRVRECWLGHK